MALLPQAGEKIKVKMDDGSFKSATTLASNGTSVDVKFDDGGTAKVIIAATGYYRVQNSFSNGRQKAQQEIANKFPILINNSVPQVGDPCIYKGKEYIVSKDKGSYVMLRSDNGYGKTEMIEAYKGDISPVK